MTESDEFKTRALVVSLTKRGLSVMPVPSSVEQIIPLVYIADSTGRVSRDTEIVHAHLAAHPDCALIQVRTIEGRTKLYVNDVDAFDAFIDRMMAESAQNLRAPFAVIS